jgi:hypothetical protein
MRNNRKLDEKPATILIKMASTATKVPHLLKSFVSRLL